MHEGSCHCGAVRIKLPSTPEVATACNCSKCRRIGGPWVYFEYGTVEIQGHPEATAEYIWGDKTLRTIHCRTCGCVTHWEPLHPTPGCKQGVNLGNFDPELIAAVRVRRFDGADTWKFIDEEDRRQSSHLVGTSGIATPRIEHVAFWVQDLERFCAFYEAHFGVQVGPLYENRAKGFASRFLAFPGGARIEAMTSTALPPASEAGVQRLGMAHVAISLGSEAEVDALTARLREQGTVVVDGPRRTGDGYYESVILDPEGNRVELTT